jgi:hypothetical protein
MCRRAHSIEQSHHYANQNLIDLVDKKRAVEVDWLALSEV